MTRDILLRPWCAGEMATSVGAGVNIIPVACGDFPGFTDDDVNEAGSGFSGSEVTLLARLGVSIPMIRKAFLQIRALAPLPINRSDPYIIHEQLVDAILKRCQSVTQAQLTVTKRGGSAEHPVVILGGQHPEAAITCHIIRMLLQRELQKGVSVLDGPLDEAVLQTKTLSHIIIILAPGILHDVRAARYLSLLAGTAKLLGVRADDSFCFPDAQFWCDLGNGLVVDGDLVDLEALSDAYRRLFATIATAFTPHASSRVHEAEIQELLGRMRAQSEPHHSGSICSARYEARHSIGAGDRGEEDREQGEGEVQMARTASETTEGSVTGMVIPGVVPQI
mmetsp:Transcript_64904/g.179996  ORF Transcript_64904/g.179996 Transcript_64904/m.179996 type:complete len:336 (+) Transcript_64904:3-1010(+)